MQTLTTTPHLRQTQTQIETVTETVKMIVIMMSMVTTLEAVEAGGHTVGVIIVVRLLFVHIYFSDYFR